MQFFRPIRVVRGFGGSADLVRGALNIFKPSIFPAGAQFGPSALVFLILLGLGARPLFGQAIRPTEDFTSLAVDEAGGAPDKRELRLPLATAARSETTKHAQDTIEPKKTKGEPQAVTSPETASAEQKRSLEEFSGRLAPLDTVSAPGADELAKLIVPKPPEPKQAPVQEAPVDPSPQKPAEADTGSTYRIGVGDVVRINVWREPEVSVDAATVRTDGKISLPLVKEVHVLGLTPRELEWLLTRAFSEFIRTPDVTVMINEINSQRVYLVGGVNNPGSMELKTPITVLQALAEAGGLTQFAKKNKITVLRQEGEEKVRLPFEYDAVMKGKAPNQNILLRAGDTIVVPE